jgi:hypothetical protein
MCYLHIVSLHRNKKQANNFFTHSGSYFRMTMPALCPPNAKDCVKATRGSKEVEVKHGAFEIPRNVRFPIAQRQRRDQSLDGTTGANCVSQERFG